MPSPPHLLVTTPAPKRDKLHRRSLDLFADNGHGKAQLEKIAAAYSPPTIHKRACSKPGQRRTRAGQNDKTAEIPENLFDVLPFRDLDLTAKEESQPYARIPYLPGNTLYQVRRCLKKAGIQ